MSRSMVLCGLGICVLMQQTVFAQGDLADLPTLHSGRAVAQHALWTESGLGLRFETSKRIVIADIKGPATITMIHFALPMAMKLNRDLVLKIFWDGETSPSVDCPLVDFFCDAAGHAGRSQHGAGQQAPRMERLLPMPFRKSARVEVVYDGPLSPGKQLWYEMPAYSYVMYRMMDKMPEIVGLFPRLVAHEDRASRQGGVRGLGGEGQGEVHRLERDGAQARQHRTFRSTRTRSSSSTANRRRRSNTRGWKTRSVSVGVFPRRRVHFP